jgi:hypothetical protein
MLDALKDVPSLLTQYWGFLALAGPLAWVVVKSKSLFLLNYRLWVSANRKDLAKGDWLSMHLQQRSELMKCRALLVNVGTYPQARRVATWSESHGLDMGTIGEAGGYFDLDKLEIRGKVPKEATVDFTSFAVRYLSIIFLVFGIICVSREEALIHFTSERGGSFYVTKDSAYPFGGRRYLAMTIDDCKKGLDPSKFGDLRKDVCDVLSDPHLPAAVSDTVVEQKTLGSMLLLLSPLLFLWTVRWKTSVRAARAIQNELQRKNSENQQVKREENARG